MPVYEEEGEKMPYSKLVKNFKRIREYNATFYFDKNEGITQTLDAEAPALSRPKRLLLLCLLIILYPKPPKYQSQPKGFNRNI